MESEQVLQNAIAFFGGSEQRMVAEVWMAKYAMKDDADCFMETDPSQTFARMATALPKDKFLAEAFAARWLLPAGRILFGLGNRHHKATLKNCYVIPIQEDSLDGIFKAAGHCARVYSRGGGCGVTLNVLRPKGTGVDNVAIVSSGAYSFADLFSCVTGTIGQHGRRGAMMIQISSDHPDCEDFVRMKDDVKPSWQAAAKLDKDFALWMDERRRVRFANVSVQLTDKFLAALERGDTQYTQTWGKESKVINPQKLWDLIIQSATNSAEPGLVFWDAIKRESPSDYYPGYEVISSNPCGEQSLAAFDSCNLSSIHLGKFVTDSFREAARIDFGNLERTVRAGVRFLDRINDIEHEEGRYPLPEMAKPNLDLRRIGLGVMGLGEMLIRLRVTYGSTESIWLVGDLFNKIAEWAYDESAEMAKEFGPFKAYSWKCHQNVPIIKRLTVKLQKKIKKYGLRNVALLSIAPTGSIAIIGQTSSGIEPYFQFQYTRRVDYRGEPVVYKYEEPIVKEYRKYCGELPPNPFINADVEAKLPEEFVSAYDIPWRSRVELQAVIQKWIDSSISSTVNLPESATFDDVKSVYMTAWQSGVKGITVYRKGSRNEVLSDTPTPVSTVVAKPEVKQVEEVSTLLDCKRITFRANSHRILMHIGFHPKTHQLIELAIRHGKTDPDLDSMGQALGILVSIALQEGMSPERIARTMRGIRSGWSARIRLHENDAKTVLVTSVPDAASLFMMRYLQSKGQEKELVDIDGAEICISCNCRAVVHENGCEVCKSCGISRCS